MRGLRRLRIGDHRVLYEVRGYEEKNELVVLAVRIAHRGGRLSAAAGHEFRPFAAVWHSFDSRSDFFRMIVHFKRLFYLGDHEGPQIQEPRDTGCSRNHLRGTFSLVGRKSTGFLCGSRAQNSDSITGTLRMRSAHLLLLAMLLSGTGCVRSTSPLQRSFPPSPNLPIPQEWNAGKAVEGTVDIH